MAITEPFGEPAKEPEFTARTLAVALGNITVVTIKKKSNGKSSNNARRYSLSAGEPTNKDDGFRILAGFNQSGKSYLAHHRRGAKI